MSHSSILGGESAANRAAGRDADLLGPSDTSDSGSDVQGERPMATGADEPDELGSIVVAPDSDSDSMGTGERGAAAGDSGREGSDILPDHIVGDEGDDIDGPLATDSTDSAAIDAIADDEDEEDDADATQAGSATGKDGRVFRVPAGTLDETGGR